MSQPRESAASSASGTEPERKAPVGARVPPSAVMRAATRLHVFLYRLTGGRFFTRIGKWDICLVTMTGAKSGKTRTVPLMYVPHDPAVILVASLGGAPKHPVWYHNLIAHPEIEVEQGGRRRKLRARQVSAEEKAKLWPICVEHYPPYADYQKRTSRDIPVFLCEPGS